MDYANLKAEIQRFQKYVIQQARSNLTKQKKNFTKSTYESLKSEQISEDNYTLVNFEMNDYGFYQDEGVKGKDPSKVSKNAKIRGQQAPNSRFKFNRLAPPAKPLAEWAKKKNIRLRDAKGKFKKGNYTSIGIIIAKNIFYRGIKPSMFFTKAFDAGFKRLLDQDLDLAVGKDLDVLLDFKITKK
jgi:hypothetical protein